MKAEKFDQIVEARGNERAQQNIDEFKQALVKAFGLLGISEYGGVGNVLEHNLEVRAIFTVLASSAIRKDWPRAIWERERKAVREELLSTMQEFQKALIAAERAEPGENTPAEETPDD